MPGEGARAGEMTRSEPNELRFSSSFVSVGSSGARHCTSRFAS